MNSGEWQERWIAKLDQTTQYRLVCGKCGARRVDAQMGLEATPEDWIAGMVAVFREIRRILRPDGTLWLNVGDSYAKAGESGLNNGFDERDCYGHGRGVNAQPISGRRNNAARQIPSGMKPKDLLMVPARLAIALQQDGWWLRSDIIWSKPNPMPESVTDRPTSAHEHVFLLAKSARYFYDAEAIRENGTVPAGTLGAKGSVERASVPGVNARPPEYKVYNGTRNARNVWAIATEPFPEAHFATFPTELAERCIKAGCPKDGTVLDPFVGSGTTCLVADRLQRHSIGIELNPAYAAMARNRITRDAGMFAEVAD